ncbi:MAG: HTH domain-containing protein [Chloroflexota bacterium]|nr:HTH domain-containing protein [Chloroflexota bacterium]MDE2962034.1 HTH domain-containing protein [Chloroflexota bacterium]
MTTQREMGWQEAIFTVLEGAGIPLKYDEITRIIGERGLRSLTGATPANTVSAYLNSMVKPEHQWYDARVSKVGRGIFALAGSETELDTPPVEDLDDEEEPNDDPEHIVRVAAFGLFWDKGEVNWSRRRLLGLPPGSQNPVNFADQMGIYILHNGLSTAYVGRTTDSLYGRLKNHSSDHKSVRWDRFSWFGFREISEDGTLLPMPRELDGAHLINILESVLIEALAPPVNGRRGDFMGAQCAQIADDTIREQRAANFRQEVANAIMRN